HARLALPRALRCGAIPAAQVPAAEQRVEELPRISDHGLDLAALAEGDVALPDVRAAGRREREGSVRGVALQVLGEVLVERRLWRRVAVRDALVRRER